MAQGGFIKLYRQMVDWEWYGDINTKTVFLHLLITANYEQKRWHGIALEPGERIISLAGLSDETGLSIMQIRRCLKNLESTREITRQTTSKYTIIKLVNYAKYQGKTTRKTTIEQQTNNKQTTTDKEVKKERSNTPLPPQGESRKTGGIDYHALLLELTPSELVQKSAMDWIEMRFEKGKKHIPSEGAVRKAFNLIRGWGYNEAQAAECFDVSTVAKWDGVFKLKVNG